MMLRRALHVICSLQRAVFEIITCRVRQFDVPLFLTQLEMMGDAIRQFFLIVCHEDQRLVGTLTEKLDNLSYKLPIFVVEAVKRLIKNQQFWIFHKGTCQETQSLLTAAKLQERTV